MNKSDLPELSQRLSQLADALGGRSPSPAGLLVWGDALQECRMDDVQAALSDWPKKYSKMPVPADILKIARERVSTRVEELAAQNAVGPDKALRAVFTAPVDSRIARRELAKMKEILSDCTGGYTARTWRQIAGNSSLPPLDWAHVLRVRHESGEQLSLMQIANYRAALRIETP
jgi:hypothetical protein